MLLCQLHVHGDCRSVFLERASKYCVSNCAEYMAIVQMIMMMMMMIMQTDGSTFQAAWPSTTSAVYSSSTSTVVASCCSTSAPSCDLSARSWRPTVDYGTRPGCASTGAVVASTSPTTSCPSELDCRPSPGERQGVLWSTTHSLSRTADHTSTQTHPYTPL